MSYILIRPDYDKATKITNHWAFALIRQGSPAADLNGEKATERCLRSAMAANPETICIAFYGHGELENLRAQTEPIASAAAVIHVAGPGVLPPELRGYKVYAVACHAGSKLGPALANAGSEFIGYARQFWIPDRFESYVRDVVNKGCLQWFIENKSREEVTEWLTKSWEKLIDDFTLGEESLWKDAFNAGLAFLWNKNSLCSY